MKKINKRVTNIIYHLTILFIMISTLGTYGCMSKQVGMCDQKEKLLNRVKIVYDSLKEGKIDIIYDTLIPQVRKKVDKRIFINQESGNVFKIDEYNTESVEIDGEIALVILSWRIEGETTKIYSYWAYVVDNWYMIDAARSKPYSNEEMTYYKKLIRGNSTNK